MLQQQLWQQQKNIGCQFRVILTKWIHSKNVLFFIESFNNDDEDDCINNPTPNPLPLTQPYP